MTSFFLYSFGTVHSKGAHLRTRMVQKRRLPPVLFSANVLKILKLFRMKKLGEKYAANCDCWAPLTFRPSGSSISQEPGMGTMGLALFWKARISSLPCERGT